MSRTAGHSMRKMENISPENEMVIAQNLCHDDVRVVPASSAGDIRSIHSKESAQVVSKGGSIPDQFRQSQ